VWPLKNFIFVVLKLQCFYCCITIPGSSISPKQNAEEKLAKQREGGKALMRGAGYVVDRLAEAVRSFRHIIGSSVCQK
jgi:hypothetical protein